jgi:hypothetical protein
MSRKDVEEKIAKCIGNKMSEDNLKEIINKTWDLESLDDIAKLTEIIRFG